MAFELSKGKLATIMERKDDSPVILQVLNIESCDHNRYKVSLSDGQYSVPFGMLTSQVYSNAGPKGLKKFCLIKITKYIINSVKNADGKYSSLLLILNLELLHDGDEVGMKIGDPEMLDETTVESAPIVKRRKLDNGSTAGSSNGGANDASSRPVTRPISSLTLDNYEGTIRAKVVTKTNINEWSNKKGQLFSFDLVDDSGKIKCVAFNDVANQFYDRIEVDKVYYFSGYRVKRTKKEFNPLNKDYEIHLLTESVIQECMTPV